VHVTDDVYEAVVAWLENAAKPEPLTITRILDREASFDPFLTCHLPASESPTALWEVLSGSAYKPDWEALKAAEQDQATYDLPRFEDAHAFEEVLSERFFQSEFVKSIAERIGPGGIQFGAVKAFVQEACTDVPVPFRSELTSHTQRIFRWFAELDPSAYSITRPRHSQILRRSAPDQDAESSAS
jgi:hypothetical protein